MKRILLVLLSVVLSVGALFGCKDKKEPSKSQTVYHTVTFKQNGKEDVVFKVEDGRALTDIPIPAAKTGYDVGWQQAELSCVTKNVTIWAIESPKSYTVNFDANGGEVSTTTQTVVYDAKPATTFPVPTLDNYDFTCWLYGETVVSDATAWTIADNVTLTAKWALRSDRCIVTFIQAGKAPVEIFVDKNSALDPSLIPALDEKTGYDIVWENKDLTNITENIIVNAIETAQTFTVTYNPTYGAVTATTQEIAYDEGYTLLTPTRGGCEFLGWKNGSLSVATTGKWSMTEDVTLVADWQAKQYEVTVTLKTVDHGNFGGKSEKTITIQNGDLYSVLAAHEPDMTEAEIKSDEYSFRGWKLGEYRIPKDIDMLVFEEREVTLEARWGRNWTDPY